MANRVVSLQDLLPDSAIRKLVPVMNRIQAGHLDIGGGKAEISRLLEPHKEGLLAKGVLADYLAYYLVHHATRGGSMPDLPVGN